MKLEKAIKIIKDKKIIIPENFWREKGFSKDVAIWLEGYSMGWKEKRT